YCGLEIRQGRNNRFFGLTIQGDTRRSAAYVGVKVCAPVNRLGAANGDVKGNGWYGTVVEGCDAGIWIQLSPNTAGNFFHGVNFSICREDFVDESRQNGYGNGYFAPLHRANYLAAPSPYGDALTIPPNSTPGANVTPSVSGGNVFASANKVPTRIVGLQNGHNGQIIALRLDANTTLVHGGTLQLAR